MTFLVGDRLRRLRQRTVQTLLDLEGSMLTCGFAKFLFGIRITAKRSLECVEGLAAQMLCWALSIVRWLSSALNFKAAEDFRRGNTWKESPEFNSYFHFVQFLP